MATIRRLRGRWQAMVRRKGSVPRCKSFDAKNQAERWARNLEGEIDRCGSMLDTRVAESMTLAELLTRYRDEISPLKRGGSVEQMRINAILRRDICYRTLAMLGSNDIAAYRDQRLKAAAPATVIREINTISHALDIAQIEWGIYLPRNPCKLVRRPSPSVGRNRRLKGDEEAHLLQAAVAGRSPYLHPLIIIAIETGMRRGEILSLTWEHVDLDRRIAHLPVTKNGEARDVPLSTRAALTLAALDRLSDGLVFSVTGHAVEQAWQHLRKRAGVPDLRFHDLRHEAVSRLFEKGLNVIEVSAISGHRELRMLSRYTHLQAIDLAARLG